MKITQSKNYRKPLYAIGLSAAVMAVAVTGCTNPLDMLSGAKKVDHTGTKDVRTLNKDYSKTDADNTVALAGEVQIDGEVAVYTEKIEAGQT